MKEENNAPRALDIVKAAGEWTHVNETIMMIGLAVAQIEKSLTDGDDSVSVLTNSFMTMMSYLNNISETIESLPKTDAVIGNISTAKEKISKALEIVGDGSGSEELKDALAALEESILPEQETLDTLSMNCMTASMQMQDTIIAFQFYDRLSQRLHQIVKSLTAMSQLIADRQRLHNPYEWVELQENIKSRYTIEADRIMFDALLAGAEISEALDIANQYEVEEEGEEDSIELF